MLPPAPKQTYIDLYIEEEDEKRLQANYEGEVVVFRVLEKLKEKNITVVHGFEYTHQQYQMCDKHDRKGCASCKKNASIIEGECDFIVIGINYAVIIEVKNVPSTDEGNLTKTFENSLKQRKRTKRLVEGLVKQIFEGFATDQYVVLSFSAFPSTSHDLFQDMNQEHEKEIIFKEDFVDFNSWWQKNVKPSIQKNLTDNVLAQHKEVKEVLVAIWCTSKNQCKELNCSLVVSIIDINEELKKGRITFSSKNRATNPNVIKVTDIDAANINMKINIFRDIIGIEYLTAEQYDAFNRDQNLLVINGPAGSGKSIILLAKIIQLIKSNEESKIVLIFFAQDGHNGSSHERYTDALQEVNISHEVVDGTTSDGCIRIGRVGDTIIENMTHSKLNSQVVIVSMDLRFANSIIKHLLYDQKGTNTHVFIDDCQAELHSQASPIKELCHTCKELSATNRVWIACDLGQISYENEMYMGAGKKNVLAFIQDTPSENLVTFSVNLRNTCDIVEVLLKIREHIILDIQNSANSFDIVDTLWKIGNKMLGRDEKSMDICVPVPNPGHFIHGPKTVMHVIDKNIDHSYLCMIQRISNMELEKLCISASGVSDSLKIAIIFKMLGRRLEEVAVSELMNKTSDRFSVGNIEVRQCATESCYSEEYPAVIVLHDLHLSDIKSLYLEISRARVYCAVLIYSSVDTLLSENQSLCNLLNELEDSVKIIRY